MVVVVWSSSVTVLLSVSSSGPLLAVDSLSEHPAPVEQGPDVVDADAGEVEVDVVKGLVVSSDSETLSSVVVSWSLMSSPGLTHLLSSPDIWRWAGQVQVYSCLL